MIETTDTSIKSKLESIHEAYLKYLEMIDPFIKCDPSIYGHRWLTLSEFSERFFGLNLLSDLPYPYKKDENKV